MNTKPGKKIAPIALIDGREFIKGAFTGIGRVLEGLTHALAQKEIVDEIVLAVFDQDSVPDKLKDHSRIRFKQIPATFLKSEKFLSELSRKDFSVFISPYPKLPLFGCFCKSIHIVHDILYLTHPAYRKRFKVIYDRYRLTKALKAADLSWYDSWWSLRETEGLVGFAGRNPKVRYPGIGERFIPQRNGREQETLEKYSLTSGYILSLGNGLPHKNLGILLQIAEQLTRPLVFAGVPEENQRFWDNQHPQKEAVWIRHVAEADLSALIRNSFCLAQPSTAEGYGYPPLEAMACGVPAVVSSTPVLTETAGDAALTADPRDPASWLAAFSALERKDNYESRIEMGLARVEPLRGGRGWDPYLADITQIIGAN